MAIKPFSEHFGIITANVKSYSGDVYNHQVKRRVIVEGVETTFDLNSQQINKLVGGFAQKVLNDQHAAVMNMAKALADHLGNKGYKVDATIIDLHSSKQKLYNPVRVKAYHPSHEESLEITEQDNLIAQEVHNFLDGIKNKLIDKSLEVQAKGEPGIIDNKDVNDKDWIGSPDRLAKTLKELTRQENRNVKHSIV